MPRPNISKGAPAPVVAALLIVVVIGLAGLIAYVSDYREPLPSQKNNQPVLVPIPDEFSDRPADALDGGSK